MVTSVLRTLCSYNVIKFFAVTFPPFAALVICLSNKRATQLLLSADFTSVQTNVKHTCKNCGTTAVLKHMHSKDPTKLGRDLCSNCYQYYCNKHTTVH